MYGRVIHEPLEFHDEDRMFDADTKSLLRGLLAKDPLLRMTDRRINAHPYFGMINWKFVYQKRYMPPFVPTLDSANPADTSNFDPAFLAQEAQVGELGEEGTDGPLRPEGEPEPAFDEDGQDVFDGYTYDPRMDGEPEYQDEEEETPSGLPDSGARTPTELAAVKVATVNGDSLKPDQPSEPSGLEPVLQHDPRSSGITHEPMLIEEDEEGADEDDWEHILGVEGEARNGGRGATLFARGVKDRYKMLALSPKPPGPGFLSRRTSKLAGSKSSDSRPSSLHASVGGMPELPKSSGLIRLGSQRSDMSAAEQRQRKAPRSSEASGVSLQGGEEGSSGGLRKSGTIKRAMMSAFKRKESIRSSTP